MVRLLHRLRLPALLGFAGLTAIGATREAPDPTFPGAVLTGPVTSPMDFLPLQDGGALIAGSMARLNGAATGTVARLTAAGGLETASFGGSVGAQVFANSSSATWVQLADGRILAAIPATASASAQVIRIGLDGTVDPSYQLPLTPPAGSALPASIASLALLPSGKIVAAGSFATAGGHTTRDVALLDATGNVDPSFSSQTHFVESVAAADDGAVAGVSQAPSSNSSLQVVRLDPTGVVTDTWSSPWNGAPTLLAFAPDGSLFAALQSGGGIAIPNLTGTVATGTVVLPIGNLQIDHLIRGQPAPAAFFTSNVASAPFSLAALYVQPDGSVLVAGAQPTLYAGQPAGLVRLLASGGVDTSLTQPALAGFSIARLKPAPDGWMADVVSSAATGSSQHAVRRLDAGFAPLADFAPDLRQGAVPQTTFALPDGSVLLQGMFENPAQGVQAFARLRADGSIDYTNVPPTPSSQTVQVAAVGPDGSVYLTAVETVTAVTAVTTTASAAAAPAIVQLGFDQVERFDATGAFDARFGIVTLSGKDAQIGAVAVDASGRIVLGGTALGADGQVVPVVERLLPSGAIDPTFVVGPVPGLAYEIIGIASRAGGYLLADSQGSLEAVDDAGAPSPASPLTVLASKLGTAALASFQNTPYALGSFSGFLGSASPAVQRFLPSGLPDPGWHSALSSGSSVQTLRFLADGKLLATGFLANSQRNALLNPDGSIDANDDVSGLSRGFGPSVDGSLYVFTNDGSVQRLRPVALPELTLTAGSPGYVAGQTLQLTVSVPAGGPVAWTHNGLTLAGATGATLQVAGAGPADAGWYSATVSTAQGAETVSIWVDVAAAGGRIANASALSWVGTGASRQTVGWVVAGASGEPALTRMVGPALAAFGVANAAGPSAWTLYQGPVSAQAPFAFPTYGGSVSAPLAALLGGAFPIADLTANPQFLASFQSGIGYSLMRTAVQPGVGLTELYLPELVTGGNGRRIANFSVLATQGGADGPLVLGFEIQGSAPVSVRIRGLGPGLAAFGVPTPASAPTLQLFQGAALIGSTSGAPDAALTPTLPAGAYTVMLTAPSAGAAMIEIDDLGE